MKKTIGTELLNQFETTGTMMTALRREHKTVTIGNCEYIAENLFCPELGWHYKNNPKNSENGYGTLHSHYAVPAIEAILPAGWRVMTDEDWIDLLLIPKCPLGTPI
jgi:uncharacterized protein (TIGR02145 family)